jgi:uncharacterized protein YcfJ
MIGRSFAVLVCAWTVTAGVAHADHRERDRHGRSHPPHHAVAYATARVLAVDPVWRRVRVEHPSERCWRDVDYVESTRRNDRTGAAIAGGVVGAVVGNQIGRGDDRVVATVVGAAAGSAIGYQLASRSTERHVQARPVERCEIVPAYRHERRIDAYRVTYVFAGRRYTQQLPYDPGRRVRIRIDGRPTIVG